MDDSLLTKEWTCTDQGFSEWDVTLQGQVLKVLVNAGASHIQQDSSPAGLAQAQAHYQRAIALGEHCFESLGEDAQGHVLMALVEAAITHSQQDSSPAGLAQAQAHYQRATALGEHRFDSLGADAQGYVLTGLGNAAIAHIQQDSGPAGLAQAQAHYQRAIALGEHCFESLGEDAQGHVLRALVEVAITHRQQNSSTAGLAQSQAHYQRAIALGEHRFESLGTDAQDVVLRALVDAGLTYKLQDSSPAGLAQAQAHYQRVINLGEHRFEGLGEDAQGDVLKALGVAGDTHLMQDSSPAGLSQAHTHWQRAIALGEHRFESLGATAQGNVLNILVNAGTTHSVQDSSAVGLAQAQAHYQRAIALGEHCFERLEEAGKGCVLIALSWNESAFFDQRRRPTALHALVLAWACWSQDSSNSVPNMRRRLAIATRNRPADGPGADRWLTRANAFPASIVRPHQAETVRLLAQARLAIHQQQRTSIFVGQTVPKPSDMQRRLARALAEKHLWPTKIDGLAHWLLALLCVHAHALLPVLCTAEKPFGDRDALPPVWQPDVAAIVQVLKLEGLRFEDGAFRAPYYLERLLPHAALTAERYAGGQEDTDTIRLWLTAWLDKADAEPLASALQSEWLRWSHATSEGANPAATPCSVMHEMADWLRQRGVANPLLTARNACLMGQADLMVMAAMASSGPALAVERGLPHRSKLNDGLNELAASYSQRQDTAWGLAQTLQRFALGGPGQPGQSAAQVWDMLEAARVGLAQRAHPKKQHWNPDIGHHGWDMTAVHKLHQAELAALAAAELAMKAREAGSPVLMPDQVDSRIEPFATMAEEWQRMGIGLQFVTPQTAAQLLQPGETLVQLWWDDAGTNPAHQGHGLQLQGARAGGPAFELNRLTLPSALEGLALQPLAALWNVVHVPSGVGSIAGAGDAVADMGYATAADLDATDQAWQHLLAPDSAARALLTWMAQHAGTAVQRVVWVLPGRLANLPWQALQEVVASGLSIELVASVGAWAQSRRDVLAERSHPPARAIEMNPATLVMAHEIWSDGGALEAREIAKTLGIAPTVSNDFADVVAALQSDGPTHLAMHGAFDAIEPMRSALVVDTQDDDAACQTAHHFAQSAGLMVRRRSRRSFGLRKGSTLPSGATTSQPDALRYAPAQLPVWALADLRIQGDVSLAVCESLQTGWGEGASKVFGAVGLGPVLMAAGARSVVGSLWSCDTWSATLFFALWYDERRSHEATQALGRARERLRALTNEQFLRWVQAVAPEFLAQAQERCEMTKVWAGPFDHPWCWAPFALLGNAPVLAKLRQNLMPDANLAPVKTGPKWWAWFQRIWKQVFRPQK